MTDVLYPKLSYKIVGLLFEVYNTLGYGLREKTYQSAIEEQLKCHKLSYIKESLGKLKIGDNMFKKYYIDFVVENKIVIELKTKERFNKEDFSQVNEYLKCKKLKLGILVNFAKNEVKFRRIVNLK